jgi:hypothetical protein
LKALGFAGSKHFGGFGPSAFRFGYMNSVTELKEALLADYIQEIDSWSQEKLLQELISIKCKELRIFIDNNEYAKTKTKN